MEIVKIAISPYGLLVISIIVLAIGRFVFKKKYLNCFDIISNHFKCFKGSNGKISKISIFLYFIVPFLISLSLVQIRKLDDTVVNILTIIVSILTSMFFTLLIFILDMHKKVKYDKSYTASEALVSTRVLEETYYSIMFEILISVAILIMCFIELFAQSYDLYSSILIYYLAFVMLMNMLMILKRVYKVIDKDLKM